MSSRKLYQSKGIIKLQNMQKDETFKALKIFFLQLNGNALLNLYLLLQYATDKTWQAKPGKTWHIQGDE